jgi:hypothetical protein
VRRVVNHSTWWTCHKVWKSRSCIFSAISILSTLIVFRFGVLTVNHGMGPLFNRQKIVLQSGYSEKN